MKRLMWSSSVAVVGFALTASSASAAVIGATVADASSGDYTLTSVSVTRGGAGTFTYVPSQLTGVDVTDVDAFSVPMFTQSGASLPAPGTRATLLEDGRLDTGITNITTTNGTPDRALEVTFAVPVINSDGEDILLFDVESGDGLRFWINNDRAGQGADRSNSTFSGNLLSGMPYTQFTYNNAGDADINSLAELETSTAYTPANTSNIVRALGIDLSLVGVPMGGSVTSMRFQSLGAPRVDPVLIVGLPAVPEPASLAMMSLGGVLLLLRKRSM